MKQLQSGNTEAAIQECKAALAEDPQYAAAHMLLGQAYLAQHSVSMVAEAKAELQQALDLDPELLWARFYLAKIYIDVGRMRRPKEQLERGLKDRPDVPHFLSLLGEVDRKLGNPEASLRIESEGARARPDDDPGTLLHRPCLPRPERRKTGDAGVGSCVWTRRMWCRRCM